MKRMVERKLIDQWLDERYPDAISQLALKSRVPANSISKIRQGWVPKSAEKRTALAKALGTTESKLFPVVQDGKERAS
jgi:hypothetical protein